MNNMMILTFNIIHNENTLTFKHQEYVKDVNNPYVYVAVNPNAVTSIGNEPFYKCESLTQIVIPNSVTFIGYFTFTGCQSLSYIVIPNSVTYISLGVFRDCQSLTMIETNDENAYIIDYCKRYYPSVEVIISNEYVLK